MILFLFYSLKKTNKFRISHYTMIPKAVIFTDFDGTVTW